jgi:hypothetical protein
MVYSCPASSENQYSLSAYFFEQARRENRTQAGQTVKSWN